MCNNNCNSCNPCGCPKTKVGCKEKDISTDCVLYTGEKLSCSGIEPNTVLTEVIKQLDTFICDKVDEAGLVLNIANVGNGAEVYKGETSIGVKQLRTLLSGSSNLNIVEGSDTITFTVESGADTYTTGGSFNSTSGLLTFIRNDNVSYSVSLAPLLQVQSNYTEENIAAKSYIQNRNPTKVITGNYTLTTGDNNYVIVVNNGNTPVNITIPSGLPSNSYFVGFIQQGTAEVSFSGFNIKPIDYSPIIYGQGHNAAVEVIGGTRFIFGSLKLE